MAAGTIGHHYVTLVPVFSFRHDPWDSPLHPAALGASPVGGRRPRPSFTNSGDNSPQKFPGTFGEAGHYLSKLGKVAACGRIGCSMVARSIGLNYVTLVPAFPLRRVPWDSPLHPALPGAFPAPGRFSSVIYRHECHFSQKFPGTFREIGHYLSKLGKVAACGRIGCSMAARSIGLNYGTPVPAFPLRHVPWDSPLHPALPGASPDGGRLSHQLFTNVMPQTSQGSTGKQNQVTRKRAFISKSFSAYQMKLKSPIFLRAEGNGRRIPFPSKLIPPFSRSVCN